MSLLGALFGDSTNSSTKSTPTTATDSAKIAQDSTFAEAGGVALGSKANLASPGSVQNTGSGRVAGIDLTGAKQVTVGDLNSADTVAQLAENLTQQSQQAIESIIAGQSSQNSQASSQQAAQAANTGEAGQNNLAKYALFGSLGVLALLLYFFIRRRS